MNKENLSSRLGFILLSAGCAIGLGNVWRFPYITGKYGGAAFVLIYLFFLFALGLPIVIAEFSIGRASSYSIGKSLDVLQKPNTKWHWFKYIAYAGTIILMAFYANISGWILNYLFKIVKGDFMNLTPEQIGAGFGNMVSDPVVQIICMVLVTAIGFGICYLGIQKGVERITKPMMLILFALIVALAVRSCSLPNAAAGLEYYLMPDFGKLFSGNPGEVIFAAMGQAVFTLSVGQGSLMVFGAYIDRKQSLANEAIWVILLDTFIAIMAGLIIFPACSSFGVDPAAGPVLLFITLPNIFAAMHGGQFWGSLFFLFMFFAALSTVITVFEGIVASTVDIFNLERKQAIKILAPLLMMFSLPCIFGFNIWSGFQPLGAGTCVLDLEDFIVSNNVLPLGSLLFILFCTRKNGWGWDNFIKETNEGKGLHLPESTRFYLTYILPLGILAIYIQGYISIFFK